MHTSVNRKLVAKKAGVAESTVSRALSGSPLISEETKAHIRRVAEILSYSPNRQASLLSQRKTFRLGFVIPYYKTISPFSRAYFPALLDGIVTAAEEKSYSVTIILGDKNLPNLVRSKEVDGLILSTIRKGDARIPQLKTSGVPFVIINHLEKGVATVSNDPVTGMALALEYAKKMGHKTIGYISGDPQYSDGVERLRAFESLVRQMKVEHRLEQGDFSKRSGYYCVGKLLQGKKRPTLIMTSSDRQALGVLEYARDHNIAIPKALSLIGFDNLDPAGFVHPSLTTVENPVRRAGEEGARLLIDLLENKIKSFKTIKLPTGFVIRESSGPLHP